MRGWLASLHGALHYSHRNNVVHQDPKIEYVPKAHDIEREALLGKAHKFIKHEAGAPEPEDQLQGSDLARAADQYGEE